MVLWNIRRSSSGKRKQRKTETKQIKAINETAISHANHINKVTHKVQEPECLENQSIPELPEPKWQKVGQIQELYVYPLKSGRGKDIRECNFTEYGISIDNGGRFALRDR